MSVNINKNYDLVVVGSGPGGYVGAIRAAQLGLKVAVIEKENLGGICLNWGCIPTKALLSSANVFNLAKHSSNYGIEIKDPKVNLDAVIKRSRKVAAQLSSGVTGLLKKNKVDVIEGFGKLKDSTTVNVETKSGENILLKAKNIILATGARARVLPGFEPDGDMVLTYREALMPKRQPKKMIVMGSGAIGIEFSYFYHSIGVDVTVIEMMDQIMPTEDKEISDFAEKSFVKSGMKILKGTKVVKIEKDNKTVKLYVEDKNKKQQVIEGDTLISAVGIVPNVENLGLENTKVKMEKGRPVVNEYLQTTDPNIYAIGDLAGGMCLAHKASHEAIICVEKIAGQKDVHPLNPLFIPACIYTTPQVASIGLKENQAKEQGYKIKVGKFPLIANGKAIALGEPEGFIKVVFDDKTGELLGAHMIGPEVTEMIQGFGVAMNLETTEKELMHTVFPHPTISESLHEAVLAAFGRAIHY